jgi:hypothetical protein
MLRSNCGQWPHQIDVSIPLPIIQNPYGRCTLHILRCPSSTPAIALEMFAEWTLTEAHRFRRESVFFSAKRRLARMVLVARVSTAFAYSTISLSSRQLLTLPSTVGEFLVVAKLESPREQAVKLGAKPLQHLRHRS